MSNNDLRKPGLTRRDFLSTAAAARRVRARLLDAAARYGAKS